MRTKAIPPDEMEYVLRLLTPPNELACRVALATGLRIGDVLRLRTRQLSQSKITVREMKTGKRRVITLPESLKKRLRVWAGDVYVFPGRLDDGRPRTRQAVWKDLRRAARALRMGPGVGTHSMRKTCAVRKFAACGDIGRVQRLLNHNDVAVTMLYAMAEYVSAKRSAGNGEAGASRAKPLPGDPSAKPTLK